MRIQEALDKATTGARFVKERHVRDVKGRPGRTDINTFIECYRGNHLVATVMLRPDRDAMLEAAWFASRGFSADVVSVTMETWQRAAKFGPDGEPESMVNPLTGRPIEQGDLGDLAMNHDGIARGWVVEALVTQVLNRAGDTLAAVQPYRIEGRQVEWLEPPGGGEQPDRFEGFVPDELGRAMQETTLDQIIGATGLSLGAIPGLSEEQARAHADIATVKVLGEKMADRDVMVMLAAERGTVREQVIRGRFPRAQVIRPDERGQ